VFTHPDFQTGTNAYRPATVTLPQRSNAEPDGPVERTVVTSECVYDQYHTLASIGAKTIVVSGGGDLVTPADHARDMVAAIEGAVHLHRPTAGHMLLQEAPYFVSVAISSAMSLQRASSLPSNAWVPGGISLARQLAAVS